MAQVVGGNNVLRLVFLTSFSFSSFAGSAFVSDSIVVVAAGVAGVSYLWSTHTVELPVQ